MDKMFAYIRRRFLLGLVSVLPIGVTIWILFKSFNFIDSLVGSTIYTLLGFKIPGLGFMVVMAIVIGAGIWTNNIIGRKFADETEKMLLQLPIVKSIYGPIRDIVNTFKNQNSSNFQKAVLVTYPMEGIKSLGFITKEKVCVEGEERAAIFIPTTPNPTSGFFVYMTSDFYDELDMPIDEALKTIVSLGTISPDSIVVKK